jgi:hypothetical protein
MIVLLFIQHQPGDYQALVIIIWIYTGYNNITVKPWYTINFDGYWWVLLVMILNGS